MIYHSLIANKVNNVATGLDTLEYSTKNIFYQKKKVIRIKKVIYSIKICFSHPQKKKKTQFYDS